MYRSYLKRFFDFLISGIALILLFPFFIIITILLFFLNKGKPFFSQLRPGRNEKIFKLYKFKTMNDNCDQEGNLLNGNERITNLGKWLRKTSIDELPQLFNVLIGDMSLIGPRPLLVEYLPLYNERQSRRHEVKPGITGLAQINGRNAITWQEKFDYDIWYVDHLCFSIDLRIIYLTVIKVISSENVNLTESVTMEKFNGNKPTANIN